MVGRQTHASSFILFFPFAVPVCTTGHYLSNAHCLKHEVILSMCRRSMSNDHHDHLHAHPMILIPKELIYLILMYMWTRNQILQEHQGYSHCRCREQYDRYGEGPVQSAQRRDLECRSR